MRQNFRRNCILGKSEHSLGSGNFGVSLQVNLGVQGQRLKRDSLRATKDATEIDLEGGKVIPALVTALNAKKLTVADGTVEPVKKHPKVAKKYIAQKNWSCQS